MSHLKQPSGTVGPFTLEHDHFAGTTKVLRGNIDYESFLSVTGITIHEIASRLYGGTPSEAQLKKVQRKLDQLVHDKKATKLGIVRGGSGGSSPARYFRIEQRTSLRTSPLSDIPDVSNDANRQDGP